VPISQLTAPWTAISMAPSRAVALSRVHAGTLGRPRRKSVPSRTAMTWARQDRRRGNAASTEEVGFQACARRQLTRMGWTMLRARGGARPLGPQTPTLRKAPAARHLCAIHGQLFGVWGAQQRDGRAAGVGCCLGAGREVAALEQDVLSLAGAEGMRNASAGSTCARGGCGGGEPNRTLKARPEGAGPWPCQVTFDVF
jgi:hypothetical protein